MIEAVVYITLGGITVGAFVATIVVVGLITFWNKF